MEVLAVNFLKTVWVEGVESSEDREVLKKTEKHADTPSVMFTLIAVSYLDSGLSMREERHSILSHI